MISLIIYPVSSVKEPQQKEVLLQDLNTKERVGRHPGDMFNYNMFVACSSLKTNPET